MRVIKTKENIEKRMAGIIDVELSYRMRKDLLKRKNANMQQENLNDPAVYAEDQVEQTTEGTVGFTADHFAKRWNQRRGNKHQIISDSDTIQNEMTLTHRRTGAADVAAPSFGMEETTASGRQEPETVEAGRRLFISKRQKEASRRKLSKTAEKSSTVVDRIVAKTSQTIKSAVKSPDLLLAASGIIIVAVIVFMCSIGLAVGSSLGIFSAGENSNPAIVEVAKTQIGNVGGEPYWFWYGFSSRVEWCSCFVSWCANECGYIDAGFVPMHADPQIAVNWYKSNDRWLPGSAEPAPGMLIFFDWDNKGLAGDQNGYADHIGIVEKVEDGWVCTIEGNTANSVARRRYEVGHYEIMGYGIIMNDTIN